jgi:hypothetical protein
MFRAAPVAVAAITFFVVSLHGQQPQAPARPADDQAFRFKSGVELINVTATVSDISAASSRDCAGRLHRL